MHKEMNAFLQSCKSQWLYHLFFFFLIKSQVFEKEDTMGLFPLHFDMHYCLHLGIIMTANL